MLVLSKKYLLNRNVKRSKCQTNFKETVTNQHRKYQIMIIELLVRHLPT